MPVRNTLRASLLLLLAVPGLACAGTISLIGGRADSGRSGYDPASTVGVRLGSELADVGLASFDGELDVAGTVNPGTTKSGKDWDFRSVGAYVTARTAGPVYLLGRVGLARESISVDGGRDVNGTQHAVGLGVGVSAGVTDLELVATRYSGDSQLDDVTWITAGFRF